MPMQSDRILRTTYQRTDSSFHITAEVEVTEVDMRAFMDSMADGVTRAVKKVTAPAKKSLSFSHLNLIVTNGRLQITRKVDEGIEFKLAFSDLLIYASCFFTDDKVNEKLREFLSQNFPNDFERVRVFDSLLAAWTDNEHIPTMEDFFRADGKNADNYPETLTMVLGYGFPALFSRLPHNVSSEEMFAISSDMKLSYEDFMTASTESELSDMVFGSRRKTFRKVTPFLTVNALSLVSQLSKIVSTDTLEWALRQIDFSEEQPMVDCWYSDADVLANFSPTVQRNLVLALFKNDRDAEDAFNMVNRYATRYSYFKGVKTIEQLHDKAMKMIPEITEGSLIEKIDHSIRSNQEVFIPEITSKVELLVNHKEFIRIGKELNICIGSASYFEKAINGESYCYKILKDGVLIGAIEIRRNKKGEWESVQCRGERNRSLETESVIVEKLLKKLEETPATLDLAGVS